MVSVEVDDPDTFDVDQLGAFLAEQPDLGTKWMPSFARGVAELPKLASMKLDKKRLQREAGRRSSVSWRPTRGEKLRPRTSYDVSTMDHLLP